MNSTDFMRTIKYSDINKDFLEQTQKALIRKKNLYICIYLKRERERKLYKKSAYQETTLENI